MTGGYFIALLLKVPGGDIFVANVDIIAEKKTVVDNTAKLLDNSVSTIIVNYRGLTVDEINDLRKQLREEGVEMHVIKNSMLRRAAAQLNMDDKLNDIFRGPTAVAFSNEEVSAPAKVLVDFAKDHEALDIKAGVVEGNLIGEDEIKVIASLPSRDDLLSMVASAVQGPIRKAAYTFKGLADQPLRKTMLTIEALAEKKDEEAA